MEVTDRDTFKKQKNQTKEFDISYDIWYDKLSSWITMRKNVGDAEFYVAAYEIFQYYF